MRGHIAACLLLMAIMRPTVAAGQLQAMKLPERQEGETSGLRTRIAVLEAQLQACRLTCASSGILPERPAGSAATTDPRTTWPDPSRVRSGTRAELQAKTNAAPKRRASQYPPCGARRPRDRHSTSQEGTAKGIAGGARRQLLGAPPTRSPSALPEWATCTDSSDDVVTPERENWKRRSWDEGRKDLVPGCGDQKCLRTFEGAGAMPADVRCMPSAEGVVMVQQAKK